MRRRRPRNGLAGLRDTLRAFSRVRDWEQFHTPRNLAISVAVEAAELLELFQWLSEAEASRVVRSKRELGRVREELADVLIYLIRLADVLGVDLAEAAAAKIARNARKYPVSASKGNAVKYSRRRTRR